MNKINLGYNFLTSFSRMLRILNENFIKFAQTLNSNPYTYNSVRWRARKPLWMGTAKSKLFKVPKKPEIPLEEAEELKRLFNNYRTHMKSIRAYLTAKHSVELQQEADTDHLEREFRLDLAKCKEINDLWNADIKVHREERMEKRLEAEKEAALKRIDEELEKEAKRLLEADEIVRRAKEALKNVITEETLDEAIENALNNPVDYNFAIDLEGNQYVGRDAKPNK